MEIQMHKPEADLKKVWRFIWAVFFIFGLIGIAVLFLVKVPLLTCLLILLGWLILSFAVLIYIKAFYKTLEYGLGGEAVIMNKGVFWRQRTTVPYVKITNIDITQDPVERMYKTFRLHLQTAGSSQSRSAELVLPGIRDCEELKDRILQRINAQVATDFEDAAPKAETSGEAGLLSSILEELSAIRRHLEEKR